MIKITIYNYLDKTYEDEYYTDEHFLKRWWTPKCRRPSWILGSNAIDTEAKLLFLAYEKFRHLTPDNS